MYLDKVLEGRLTSAVKPCVRIARVFIGSLANVHGV